METVPEGKIMMHPPSDMCFLAFFLVSRLVKSACLSPVKSMGSKLPLVSGALKSKEWTKSLKSFRFWLTNQLKTKPSSTPNGWLATIIAGPVAGIFSKSISEIFIFN